ncbi:MAG: dihydropteroate synthase [Candidatus Omnitrophota bacterium]|jgi:dihydropteroate synthase
MRITPIKIENQSQAQKLMTLLGVTRQGADILSPKSVYAVFKIEGIRSWEANIIKQHLLSLGSDSAIERNALIKNINTATIIFGSISQLNKLCVKLKNQPFNLKEIADELSLCLTNMFKTEFIFKARNKTLEIKKPVICGIINLTTDSFSGDGLLKYQVSNTNYQKLVLKRVEEMIKDGAGMIDLGAESTRPYSKPISEKEEVKRIAQALRTIRKEFKNVMFSVDTYKFNVAKVAVEEGADIINDITALRKAPAIINLLKKHKLGVILMHMKGNPSTMQKNPYYENVTEDILDFFKKRILLLGKEKIEQTRVLFDPGIGFGKTAKDNLKIIKELYKIKTLGYPVFLGLSRKAFIGKIIEGPPDARLYGTIAANVVAYMSGANILRVHDVKENSQALNIAFNIINN